MITKTGIDYSTNSDLSPSTFSGNIEENGQVSSITIPNSPILETVYVRAYCIDEGVRIESEIKNYLLTDYFYIKNEYAGQNTVSLICHGNSINWNNGQQAKSVEYSKDKTNWTTFTLECNTNPEGDTTNIVTTLEEGETVYFRNDSGNWNAHNDGYNYFIKFTADHRHSAGGNMITLLKYSTNPTRIHQGCFKNLFADNQNLINTPRLPLTTLVNNCYTGMFYGCTSLTTLPSDLLPATTLAQFCYYNMFAGCTSLTSTPVLPATTLVESCYQGMFSGCTSLTTAPALPATTLASYCYQQMFNGCTSLTSTPELPATTLVYNCYNSMFYGCTSLNEVIIYANNISDTDCLKNWLKNVSSRGTFHKLGTANFPSGVNGIPSGWTVVTT